MSERSTTNSSPRRGFLLLVVVGLLAVLLVVIVGFLSFTRTELSSIAHIRDNCDTADLAQSAVDWTLGNISQSLFIYNASTNSYIADPALSSATATGAPKYVTNSNDTATGQFWYTPYDADVPIIPGGYNGGVPSPYTSWGANMPGGLSEKTLFMQQKFATWRYMPQDYFADGSILGRFQVQVIDANAALNINDWNEDCNPTQCQMTHVIQGGYGIQNFEGGNPVLPIYGNYRQQLDKALNPAYGGQYRECATERYLQCWQLASRTTHYLHFNWSYTGNYEKLCPNFTTTNTAWQGLFGSEFGAFKSYYYNETGQYKLSPGGWWPYLYTDHNGLGGFAIAGYVDPDTGRSPLNVNTCEICGSPWPCCANFDWAFQLEGVFNVESLVRIIKVGKFWCKVGGKNWLLDAQNPGAWTLPGPDRYHSIPGISTPNTGLTSDQVAQALQHEEQLKMLLAYHYQEMIIRYFDAYYHPYTGGNNGVWFESGATNDFFRVNSVSIPGPPVKTWAGNFAANRSYYQAFGYYTGQNTNTVLGPLTVSGSTGDPLAPSGEAFRVRHANCPDGVYPPTNATSYVPSAYYSSTRFPCDVNTFRQWVAADLIAMTRNNGGLDGTDSSGNQIEDPTGGSTNAWNNTKIINSGYLPQLRYNLSQQLQNGVVPDGELCVNFDSNNIPEIIPGKMDKRTANAIFDNIIPGKTWTDATGKQHFLLFGEQPGDSNFTITINDGGGVQRVIRGSGSSGKTTYYTNTSVRPAPNPPAMSYPSPIPVFPSTVPPYSSPLPGGLDWTLGPDVTGNGIRDPLWELYSCRLGRDEYGFAQNNRQNFYVSVSNDPTNSNSNGLTTPDVNNDNSIFNDKGKDIYYNPNASPGSLPLAAPYPLFPNPYASVPAPGTPPPFPYATIPSNMVPYDIQIIYEPRPNNSQPTGGPAASYPWANAGWLPPPDKTDKVSGTAAQRPLVPWRQLVFGPDWFSTELTTASTTYYLVVSSEIVDKQSAITGAYSTTNPNPTPTVISHNQQLICVELAPDIAVETDPSYDGSLWPTGVPPAKRTATYTMTTTEGQRVGLGYYRGGWPRILKTAQVTDTNPQWVGWTTSPPSPAVPAINTNMDNYSMDYGMATCYQVNQAGTHLYQPALPDTTNTTQNQVYPSNNSTSVSSVPPQWLDFRCPVLEPEPINPSPPSSRLPTFETNFYKAENLPNAPYAGQTTKRVIVRYTWNLNQGL